ncbi:copper resistance protein CopC [Paraglaciecola aquimarina]|jgi:methionine-rich copper-binding protein CopC|uniref:Copper resistance protein CopC n=1 Tax=Paraglaciecola algarum TaxID=3050085 RepID=A0ABS9D7Q4_9ALTE|nr:copper resistance CopC family protein [Paraglaciecola sp. G1-23]MCF2948820.1 copper resistance protein CopC [Paraglaciecola sp. G1-23]MDN4504088.1 copper resistance protein CopC [Alteromonadaceae bacterium BrNp21-10]
MKTLIKFLTVISVVFSSAVFAHVHLEKTVPADNAMLMKTPEELKLKFSKEVRLVKVSLKNKQGEKVKFGFIPSKEANGTFSWKLPKLSPANYIVDVTFLGNDGHKMKNSFGFMVH